MSIYDALASGNVNWLDSLQRVVDGLPDVPIGEFHRLTWRQLLLLSVDHSPKQIGRIAGIETKQVERFQTELIGMVRDSKEE